MFTLKCFFISGHFPPFPQTLTIFVMPQKFERQEAYKIYYIKGKQKISPAIPNIHRRKRKNMGKKYQTNFEQSKFYFRNMP